MVRKSRIRRSRLHRIRESPPVRTGETPERTRPALDTPTTRHDLHRRERPETARQNNRHAADGASVDRATAV
jgi:hypothetical protein